MYGLSPKAMTEKLASVPPEKISNKPKNWLEEKSVLRLATFTPATGIWAKRRKMMKMTAVKRIFLRIPSTWKLRLKIVRKFSI